MKKFIFTTVLAILTVSTAPAVLADPAELVLTFICPSSQDLGNSGDSIAGFGSEARGTANPPAKIYFSSQYNNNPLLPKNIPNILTSYRNTQATYDGASQKIVCDYMGQATSPFQVSYQVTNGKNARVIASTTSSIIIGIPVGTQ